MYKKLLIFIFGLLLIYFLCKKNNIKKGSQIIKGGDDHTPQTTNVPMEVLMDLVIEHLTEKAMQP